MNILAVELPNVQLIDCIEAGLGEKAEKCFVIKFESSGLTEYAKLHKFEGQDTILEGTLFTSDLEEIEDSRVSASILDNNKAAQVEIEVGYKFVDIADLGKQFLRKMNEHLGHDSWIRGN